MITPYLLQPKDRSERLRHKRFEETAAFSIKESIPHLIKKKKKKEKEKERERQKKKQ